MDKYSEYINQIVGQIETIKLNKYINELKKVDEVTFFNKYIYDYANAMEALFEDIKKTGLSDFTYEIKKINNRIFFITTIDTFLFEIVEAKDTHNAWVYLFIKNDTCKNNFIEQTINTFILDLKYNQDLKDFCWYDQNKQKISNVDFKTLLAKYIDDHLRTQIH